MALDQLSVTGENKLRIAIRDGSRFGALTKSYGIGTVPALSTTLTFGTGSGQANKLYYAVRTLAGTTMDTLDLAGSLTDGVGNTLTFTYVKLAIIAIESPNGTKALRVGPQNEANAFVGSWGASAATTYKTVKYHDIVEYEPVTGLAVTAGTGDIFPVYNPTGSSITYHILIAGV